MPQKAYIINDDLTATATRVGQQYQYPSQHGPFRQGTDTFTVIETNGPPLPSPTAYYARVYLAPLSKASVEQDAANAPQLSTDGSGFGVARSGSTVYIAYPNHADKGLSVITFDMVTKQYGVAVNNADNTAIVVAACAVLANGDLLIQTQPNGTSSVSFTVLSAGVFSAYQVLKVNGTVGTFAVNGNVAHVWYGDALSPPHIRYRSYSGGVLSAEADTGALGLVGANIFFGPASYSSADELLVPFSQQANAGPLALLRGSPSAAPVWTNSVLVNTPATGTFGYLQVPAITEDASGNLYYAWRLDDAVSGTATVSQVLYMTQTGGAGAWSASSVYYDFYANPPTNSTVYVFTGVNPLDPPTPAADNFVIYEDQGGLASGVNSPAMSIAVLPGDSLSGVPFSAVFAATTVFNPDGNYYADASMLFSAGAPIAQVVATNPGDGGRKIQVLTPNQFDFCLHREYRLFCNIDYDLKGCARLPKCFTVDEREWGDQA